MNVPLVITDLCASKNLDNSRILSDGKYKYFATKTNIYIKKMNKLARSFIILDENNIITNILLNKEIVKKPNFKELEKLI